MNRIGMCIGIWALLCLSSSSFCSSHYDKFAKCKVPVHCGETEISYPFYLDSSQPPYYGEPVYNVSSSNKYADFPFSVTLRSPTIFTGTGYHLVGYNFRIWRRSDIPGSLRLQLLNEAILNVEETCTVPDVNIVWLFDTKLAFGPKYGCFLVLYGECNKPLPSNLTSYSTSNCSDPILLMQAHDPYSDYASNQCRRRVLLPMGYPRDHGKLIVASPGGGHTTNWSEYRNVVGRGFAVYLRVPSSCVNWQESGGICGYEDGFKCFCGDGFHPQNCTSQGPNTIQKCFTVRSKLASIIKKMGKPLGFSAGGLALVVVVIIILRAKEAKNENSKVITDFLRKNESLILKRYKYWEIKKITQSFKDKLGQGGFGTVYKGELKDGRQVAVKVLSSTKCNDGEDFMNEVASISRTSHVNIVGLIGFCVSGSKRALIYPFMVNGSLEKFIYEEKLSGPQRILEWKKLHNIALGIAQGLEYLHRGCNTRIVHFDIKPHNILLDEDLCPKISDFGLAKVCVRKDSVVSMLGARGTVGYIAPEQVCRNFGPVSHKSDVYSYGMMILEMVGGRKNIDAQVENASEIYFPHWIYKRLLLDQVLELNGIINEEDKVQAKKMIIIGLWCIQIDPVQRPPMSRVVEMLQGSIESLSVPPKPYLYSPSNSPQHFLAPIFTSSAFTIASE